MQSSWSYPVFIRIYVFQSGHFYFVNTFNSITLLAFQEFIIILHIGLFPRAHGLTRPQVIQSRVAKGTEKGTCIFIKAVTPITMACRAYTIHKYV